MNSQAKRKQNKSQKPKIIHLIPKITYGGAENVVLQLCNNFAKQGYPIHLLTVFQGSGTRWNQFKKLTYITKNKRKILSYFFAIMWIIKNKKIFKSAHFLHLHLTQSKILGVFILLLKKLFNYRYPLLIETYHAAGLEMNNIIEWVHKKISFLFDGVVLVAIDKKWMGSHQNKIAIIRNSFINETHIVSKKRKAQFLRDIKVPKDMRFLVGTLGLFRPERRPLEILEVFFEIALRTPSDVHFLFSGDGVLKNKILKRAYEKKLIERIHFPGLAQNANLHFSVMDLYISLNAGSTTGVAGMEAIHMGVATLAFQVQKKYTTQSNDLIWSSSCPIQVAEKAVLLLSRPVKLRELASRQKKLLSETHSREKMIFKYEQFYRRVLSRAC